MRAATTASPAIWFNSNFASELDIMTSDQRSATKRATT